MKNYILYNIILYLHFIYICFLYFGWISNNQLILETHLVLLIITITLFYFCNGCIITKIERMLSKSNFTIIDPLLQKFGFNPNNINRTKITLSMFIISLIITMKKIYFKDILYNEKSII